MGSLQDFKVCILCCRSITYCGETQRIRLTKIQQNMNILKRFLWIGSEDDQLQGLPADMTVHSIYGCCDICVKMVDNFCKVYHQIQCLNMQLNWKLSKLLDSMNLANKIPSRWKKLNKTLREKPKNDSINISEIQIEFRRFRGNVMKAGKRTLKTSVPRVKLDRNEQVIRNAISKESVPKIIWSPVRISDEDNPLDENVCNVNDEYYGDADDNSTVFVDCNDDMSSNMGNGIIGNSTQATETVETFDETSVETKLEFPFPHLVSCVETEVVSETICPLIIESVTSLAKLPSPIHASKTLDLDRSSSTSEDDSIESADEKSEICEPNVQIVDEKNVSKRKADRSETNVKLALVAQKYLQKYRNFKRPRYKQYTKNDLTSALKAVQNGMRRHQAARTFNIPSRTLYQRVDKHGILLPTKRKEKFLNEKEGNISDDCSISDEETSSKQKPIYKKYTKNDLHDAINEVKEGRVSALKAARKFRIPSRTLYDKLKTLKVNPTRKYLKDSRMSKANNQIQRQNVESDESSSDIGYEPNKKSKRLVITDSSSDTEIEDRDITKSSNEEESSAHNEQVHRRKRDRRKHKQYTIDNMRLAIQAVQEGMSYRLAGKKFSVPGNTIRSRMKKLGSI